MGGPWKIIRRSLGFGGCCRSDWDTRESEQMGERGEISTTGRRSRVEEEEGELMGGSSTSLAMAFAAERDSGLLRRMRQPHPGSTPLTHSSRGEAERDEEEEVEEGTITSICCVCMVRRKGSAFIPCGHTFCRECIRDIWLNRDSCALCNQKIHDVLDII